MLTVKSDLVTLNLKHITDLLDRMIRNIICLFYSIASLLLSHGCHIQSKITAHYFYKVITNWLFFSVLRNMW